MTERYVFQRLELSQYHQERWYLFPSVLVREAVQPLILLLTK